VRPEVPAAAHMAVPSHRFATVVFAGILCATSVCRAQAAASGELDPGAAFDRARLYYESAKYSTCVDAFSRLLERSEGLRPKERAAARTYLAACLIASKRVDDARTQFRQAILEDRQLEPPDPVVFPQAVIDVFVQVRASLMDALRRQQEEDFLRSAEELAAQRKRAEHERQRVAELERLASTETLIRKNERWMAWLPFGLGQFHNDSQTLGWIFLSTELALAGTAITATSIELGLHSRAQGGRAPLDAEDLTNKVRAAHQVGTAAWLALIGVAVAGIVEANVSFRSELPAGHRRRVLPDSVRPTDGDSSRPGKVSVVPAVGEHWVGVSGTF
jgi:tetratricopeptide (TPR) repeat protein